MAENNGNVKSVERALSILACFSRERPSMTLMDIAHAIDLSPSTTSRLIATLEKKDFLRRDPLSLQYSLGYKLAYMGNIALQSNGLREVAHTYLQELHYLFNETTGLYVVDRTERVCIDCICSTQPLQRYLTVGTRMPLDRGSSGKLLLAYLPTQVAWQILQNSRSELTMDMLESIRKSGYSVSYNEHSWGVSSVATPIFNADQTVEAALFIAAPSIRMSQSRASEMVEACIRVGQKISSHLGY